jgi:hypothetical protein
MDCENESEDTNATPLHYRMIPLSQSCNPALYFSLTVPEKHDAGGISFP